ncbi:hypothetical protein SAMN05878482_1183 [Peribacillus simplex]|uniref:Uncharacterized protein n=1 Tax=Peribacillus simplex TaxID=1478 RepID=A0A9X8RF69_9BACI|nr:hypothetical protein SAMN05878482_1183 [Peribacillus simplex]
MIKMLAKYLPKKYTDINNYSVFCVEPLFYYHIVQTIFKPFISYKAAYGLLWGP